MVRCFQPDELILWIMNDKGRYHSLIVMALLEPFSKRNRLAALRKSLSGKCT